MNQTGKWWYAQIFLGFHVLLHYAKKLWPWHARSGLKKFQQNYIVEGLPAYSASFRAIAFQPGKCTGCGICDSVCPLLLNPVNNFLGPMRTVASVMRGGPLLEYALSDLSTFAADACVACRSCEIACPEAIPISELATKFTEQWEQVNAIKFS